MDKRLKVQMVPGQMIPPARFAGLHWGCSEYVSRSFYQSTRYMRNRPNELSRNVCFKRIDKELEDERDTRAVTTPIRYKTCGKHPDDKDKQSAIALDFTQVLEICDRIIRPSSFACFHIFVATWINDRNEPLSLSLSSVVGQSELTLTGGMDDGSSPQYGS